MKMAELHVASLTCTPVCAREAAGCYHRFEGHFHENANTPGTTLYFKKIGDLAYSTSKWRPGPLALAF
jgi:hypothetical protein